MIETVKAAKFPETVFQGTISDGKSNFEVTLTASVDSNHRLQIEPVPVSSECYDDFRKHVGEPGGRRGVLALSASSSDGTKLESKHVEIVGWSSSSEDGFSFMLDAVEATISLDRVSDREIPEVFVRMKLRGFKSLRPKPVQSRLGELIVSGAHSDISPDDVSGSIVLHSYEAEPSENWYTEALDLVEFVRKGLEFGHGGRLQAPLIEIYRPLSVNASLYSGVGTRAHLKAIHFMDQSEYIAALVARFEHEDPFPEAVWLSVGWLNSHTEIYEAHYLTLMAAIETIIHNLVPDAQTTTLPRGEFAPIRDALYAALCEFNLPESEKEIFQNNICGINKSPLSLKLNSVLEKYNLPSRIFDKEAFKQLNQQRNAIIHTGKPREGVDLWTCILRARELIAVIVFSEIGYQGRYESYAAGYDRPDMAQTYTDQVLTDHSS